jgi:hypothetical protein
VRANLGDPHQREDRLRALVEARRVLRPGRVVLAAGISRFASTIDRLAKEALADPRFETMVEGDLCDGCHVNPDPAGRPNWFTTACFHRREDLGAEVETAELALEALLGGRERWNPTPGPRRLARRPRAPRTAHASNQPRRRGTRTARCESPPARRRPRLTPNRPRRRAHRNGAVPSRVYSTHSMPFCGRLPLGGATPPSAPILPTALCVFMHAVCASCSDGSRPPGARSRRVSQRSREGYTQ